ncbi:MAG: class I SAM-dependent methyltransferase [Methyloversatilis sp.]|nr:class I SAM-dependent methyltransferase [Methyloversatilis sp.]MBP6193800.1 class I SAM-dependent methyltransferase [Methyloversatilis sp.]MBP9118135.1 class I SAM-dependent methyltransferase [Methyloversatilis sp.]
MDNVDQYRILHQTNPGYGASSIKFIEEISLFIEHLRPRKVLDFGCGKGTLIHELTRRYPEVTFVGYDPAIPGREHLPDEAFDLVINTDVLEHIPEQTLPEVVKKISTLSQNVYFNLHHAATRTILPNGENAHCTIKPPEWYHALMRNHFNHVVPLKGRRDYLSVVITFPVPTSLLEQYAADLTRLSKRPLWKRLLRTLAGRC